MNFSKKFQLSDLKLQMYLKIIIYVKNLQFFIKVGLKIEYELNWVSNNIQRYLISQIHILYTF